MAPTLIDALSHIERSGELSRTPTLLRVLRYLVAAEVEGRAASLSAYRVATEAFGKPQDFDPSASASVRVEMARLRRLLEQRLKNVPGEPGIEIPQGTYRPRLVAAAAPAADVALPRLAVAPSGPGVLVVGLTSDLPPAQRHVAVGLGHAIFEELARFRWLYVVDALDAGGHQPGLLEQAVTRYECQFVLRGSVVEPLGDGSYGVRVELMDAAARRLVWSNQFDFTVDQLEPRRAEIANSVARAVGQPMGPVTITVLQAVGSRPVSDRWATADLSLRFHVYLAEERTAQAHAALQARAEAIVRASPYFALGWKILGCLARDEYSERFVPGADRDATLARAASHLQRAMNLDPMISRAAFLMATVRYFQADIDGFRHWLRTALSLNVNHPEHSHWGGAYLCLAGNVDEGMQLMARAGLQQHHALYYRLGTLIANYTAGRDAEAMQIADGMPIDCASYLPHLWCAIVHGAQGRREDGAAALARARRIAPALATDLDDELRRWMLDPTLAARAAGHLAALGAVAPASVPS